MSDKFQKNLPNFEKAEIDPDKFYRYSMDPGNISNQNKWMAFEEIGYQVWDEEIRKYDAQDVIDQLKKCLYNAPAIPGKTSKYGQRYNVSVQLTGPNGKTGTLVTIWQIETQNNIPRLITNWLEVHR
ncbi:MAG: hypothetical protein GY795_16780 [Desulfobacterales bacterium]|nr:hypothetical protein [Desulfobacterales bacterium]